LINEGKAGEMGRTLSDQKPDTNSTQVEPIQELLNAESDSFALLVLLPFEDSLTEG